MAEIKIHQIVFRSNGGVLRISCQCRASETKHVRDLGGGEYYEPFSIVGYETFWHAYNDPENHYVPFTEEDKVRI